ncbi:cilia- and flagella-associated protein 418-like [Centruroides vittatus]|uniref:cilia- and flagella-associated protein 418-like n=1 Tax=Centruroides vittatus TaxID=120091 RepID=UPI00350F0F60
MADDLDELLDEVESELLKEKHVKNKATRKIAFLSTESSKSTGDELEAAIDDICNIPEPLRSEENSSNIENFGDSKKRCFPIYLGGTSIMTGLSTNLKQRTCDNLRCIKCDFKVSSFDNFTWKNTTDYIFLRNNMPDFNKLKVNLESKPGYRAYSCQCQYCSVKDLSPIKTFTELKWVCGHH